MRVCYMLMRWTSPPCLLAVGCRASSCHLCQLPPNRQLIICRLSLLKPCAFSHSHPSTSCRIDLPDRPADVICGRRIIRLGGLPEGLIFDVALLSLLWHCVPLSQCPLDPPALVPSLQGRWKARSVQVSTSSAGIDQSNEPLAHTLGNFDSIYQGPRSAFANGNVACLLQLMKGEAASG